MKDEPWTLGNRAQLLENGEEYFPRVLEALHEAQSEIFVETFILHEDKVGIAFQHALIAAAGRGLRVELTVDGYGSFNLTPAFIEAMTQAGVRYHVYRPQPRLFSVRTNMFRRLHRKIVSIDGRLAFIGGINIELTHLLESGPESKQDYAVELEGPVARQIHHFAELSVAKLERRHHRRHYWWHWRREKPLPAPSAPGAAGDVRAIFVVRDNERHRNDIERRYRQALRAARSEVLIANPYFFPGYRLLRDIRNAARRGVDVRLILQGRADMQIAQRAAEALYGYLLRANVMIYEYRRRPLHAKVALVDDEWSTIGSSNLDPLSLFLNLECNVVLLDSAFNQHLRERLYWLMENSCERVQRADLRPHRFTHYFLGFVMFHVFRRMPRWSGWAPAHRAAAEKEGEHR